MKYLGVLVFSLAACGDDSAAPPPEGATIYSVTFDAAWSMGSHPTGFPANPHFSPLIGMSHPSGTSFFEPGAASSPGVTNMAETGGVSPLDSELDAILNAGGALDTFVGTGVATSPGSASGVVGVDSANPNVSLTTMIAPSPDWFVGLHDVSLVDASGNFVPTLTVDVAAWDAGTDSGVDFASANDPTSPAATISTLDVMAVTGSTDAMGSVTFTLMQ